MASRQCGLAFLVCEGPGALGSARGPCAFPLQAAHGLCPFSFGSSSYMFLGTLHERERAALCLRQGFFRARHLFPVVITFAVSTSV